MAASPHLATKVRRTLTAVLPEGLHVEVKPRRQTVAPSFDVTVRAGVAAHRFVAGWAGEGWPADVERLEGLVPGLDVVLATNLSDGAREWLSRRGLGWADETGRASISRRSGLVISREPRNMRTHRDQPPARWRRSMLTVAEAVLAGVVPTVEGIEQVTGLSRNATASALDRLERLGLLERPLARRGPMSGRRVVDMNAFLDAYASAAAELHSKQSPVLVHRLWSDPLEALRTEIAPALDAEGTSWAVTGVAASLLIAPYLSDVTTLELYVDRELFADSSRLASLLGGRQVDRGHRIEIRQLPTTMSTRGPVIDGVHVALPARVYADLVATGGRSAEAAHHLRETLDVGTAA
jgi:hypothetical protein